MAERIGRLSPQDDVFRSVVENAIQLSGSGNSSDALLEELCRDEGLASVSVPSSVICTLESASYTAKLFSCRQHFNF